MQAEEEGGASAAAPSKAALKRARRKAAAAAAPPGPATELAENGAAASAALSTAHEPASVHADPTATRHAPAQSTSNGGTRAATVDGAAATQSSMQQLRLQDGNADMASPSAVSQKVPGWMMCPLTHAVLADPVLCTGDGQTYERSAITQWLAASDTSPVTGQRLTSRDILPNHALRSIIEAAQARAAQRAD